MLPSGQEGRQLTVPAPEAQIQVVAEQRAETSLLSYWQAVEFLVYFLLHHLMGL